MFTVEEAADAGTSNQSAQAIVSIQDIIKENLKLKTQLVSESCYKTDE